MTKRKTTGADVWVILTPEQVAWLYRNAGGSLTTVSEARDVVRISNFPGDRQLTPEDK
jgi:hypothetical protein